MPLRELNSYQAVNQHSVINRCLKKCISENLEEFNITLTEWLMLGYIVDRGPKGVRNTTIAHNLRLEMPVVTKLVKNSVDSGWLEVTEDKKDGRAKRVVATNAGVQMVYKTDEDVKKRAAVWLNDIDPVVLKDYFKVQAILAEKSKETN